MGLRLLRHCLAIRFIFQFAIHQIVVLNHCEEFILLDIGLRYVFRVQKMIDFCRISDFDSHSNDKKHIPVFAFRE